MSTAPVVRYPAPLVPGATIAVTAPSAGVEAPCHRRLDIALGHLRSLGFDVREGRCLRASHLHVSAPPEERAAELMDLLTDDGVAAVLPPWGGELLVEILPLLDLDRLARATPRWIVGFSDVSTLLLAVTLGCGWATAHGANLMDLVPGQDDPLSSRVLAHLGTPAGGSFEQRSSARWQPRFRDFAEFPESTFDLTEPTRWTALDGAPSHRFEGRLIGGCLDTVSRLAPSPHGDVPAFARRAAADGVVVYLENCELPPLELARALWSLRLAGWFEDARGILLGRSTDPRAAKPGAYDQEHALRSAFAGLDVPVLCDADIGHLPPQMLLVNGALASVEYDEGAARVVQTLS